MACTHRDSCLQYLQDEKDQANQHLNFTNQLIDQTQDPHIKVLLKAIAKGKGFPILPDGAESPSMDQEDTKSEARAYFEPCTQKDKDAKVPGCVGDKPMGLVTATQHRNAKKEVSIRQALVVRCCCPQRRVSVALHLYGLRSLPALLLL